ncbi:DUF4097 family beta strand repeat-containing protein [Hymenobacter sp. BT559]|uniref:DUF4097 family beta strand repeat-containing protein n=1 Tax=Hymenobacter sp. BT559 TaxID=2795729 RepID=UPI0018EE3B0F|nr:DUF4097 family beta strand repeat-containing protein [Hymenobacter sp. BT559]MBJ6144300.1 DUF4097 family beta strand repeat protein [Hymenobacter sp. BT559]
MKSLALGLLLLSGLAATAQTVPAPTFTSTCQERNDGRQKLFCETRDLTLPATAGQPLTIDASTNGSISVKGWDGPDVRMRAKVTAWADTEAEAKAQATAIRISTASNELVAKVPNGVERAAVSYEVFVPRRMALALTTQNGSIYLAGVQSAITFSAQNGSVSLANLGGQVTGKAVNGSLSIKLSGNQWQGSGLDVETVNGSIRWEVPADYSAQFSTSTTNGSLKTTLPQSDPKSRKHEVNTALGKGGQPVKAVTTNGSVVVRQS